MKDFQIAATLGAVVALSTSVMAQAVRYFDTPLTDHHDSWYGSNVWRVSCGGGVASDLDWDCDDDGFCDIAVICAGETADLTTDADVQTITV